MEKASGESVRAIGPCEDVREAPRSHLGFGFFAGGRRHCRDRGCDIDWLLLLLFLLLLLVGVAEIVGQFLIQL